jgi:hypothetical protein
MYTVKQNRCFEEAFTLKYKGSQTDTVEAGDFAYFTFYSDNITDTDACAVSVVHAGSSTIDDITVSNVIGDGAVQVKVVNSGSADLELTVNVAVL